MGSNDGEPMNICENNAANCSATTVEIRIKTLDSQTFTLRVDKCVPVPELKEQIASLTGVISEQQRLICRGKVLKDDQLLSAYHVEDGHTLHMVVRQPVPSTPESSSDQPATDPTSSTGGNRVGPGMVIGTFSLPEQGDGSLPDLNRIVSAVLSSFGHTRFGSGGEGIDLNLLPSERLLSSTGLAGLRNSSSQQSDQPAVNVESLQPPIIPDSLTTLLQYLSCLRQEFAINAISQNVRFFGSDEQGSEATLHSNESRRLLTPEFLAEVMSSTRQLLSEQASDSLLQLAGQLSSHASMTNPLERSRIQSNAIRSGTLFQNLGYLLLELGRAIMTLRMGQSPADALVNAGPSVYLSSTGPNPIMVQPQTFQPGASFGLAPHVRTAQHGSGPTGGGSSFLPRNIDIRIRTGSVISRREPTGLPAQGQGAPAPVSNVNSVQQDHLTGLDSNSRNGEPQVRAIPLRTVPSHGSIGLLYPVLARVQHVTSANPLGISAPPHTAGQQNGTGGHTEQHMPDSAAHPQNTGVFRASGNTRSPGESLNDQGFATQLQSGLEQFLQNIFPDAHVVAENTNTTASGSDSVPNPSEAAADAAGSSQEAAASTVSEEGIVFSNLLRQIMPLISQNTGSEPNMPPTEGANSVETRQDGENQDEGASSHRSSESQQNIKRQKRGT